MDIKRFARTLITLLVPITTLFALSGCGTLGTALRLCGIGALNQTKECVVSFWGDTRSGQITGTSAQLVSRRFYPSAVSPKKPWEIEIDNRCGIEALRLQQEHYSRFEVSTPYAPLETACKRRERLRHTLGIDHYKR